MADAEDVPNWERIQKKTFTKWCNTHLNRAFGEAAQLNDILTDWQSGIKLMQLTVALYAENDKNPEQAVSMPKLKPNELAPKNKIAEVSNCNKAIALLTKAGVVIRGLAAENLVDHGEKDKPTILGMVYQMILDYAARGFGGSSAEVKRALLEWVNKKTDGYERVNPPGVKGFTKDWSSGLAWCALIHRHRPDLLNYDECLTKTNAENLELAFSVADSELGIPRLLDVEDMDVDLPDEKSVITYTMEYFLRFASEGLKEQAAKQAADWLQFLRQIRERQNDYERRARLILNWTKATRKTWEAFVFGDTKQDAQQAFMGLRNFVTVDKPPQEAEKMDLEALFAEIQTTLKINGLQPYVPPADVEPEQIEKAFGDLVEDQSAHGRKVRENKFRFIEKKDDQTGEELNKQIEESFQHYDENSNGQLNKTEFNAACMEMGIALKSQEEKDALFVQVAKGGEDVSKENYHEWMVSRLVVKMDDPESIKNAFKTIADNRDGLSEAQLKQQPLTDADREFMMANMKQNDAGLYDYNTFVTEMMA